jgi:hypothetical protein
MPTSDEPQPDADITEQPERTEAPKEPSYVTRDELNGLRDAILGTVRETVRESVHALRAETATTKTAPVIEDVTDAEIEAQLAEGKPVTHLIRKAAKAEAARAVNAMRDTDVTPFRNLGSAAVRDLVMDRASEKMPLRDNTVFQREVKPLIDRAIANLPEEGQLSLGAIMGVYDFTMGRIQRESPKVWEAIEAENRERKLRSANTGDGGQTGGSSIGRAAANSAKPRDLEDVVGDGGVAALADLGGNRGGRPSGRTYDEFAKSLGYTPDQYRRMLELEEKAKTMTTEEYLAAIKEGSA